MVLTSFLAGFLRDGDFFGIPTLKMSWVGRPGLHAAAAVWPRAVVDLQASIQVPEPANDFEILAGSV